MGSGTSHKDGVTQPPGVVADATGLLPPMGLTAAKGVPGSKLGAQLSGELLGTLLRKHKGNPCQAISDFLDTEIHLRDCLSPSIKDGEKWKDTGGILFRLESLELRNGNLTGDDDVKWLLWLLSGGDKGGKGNLQHRRELAGLYFTLRRMVFPDAPFPSDDVRAAGLQVPEAGETVGEASGQRVDGSVFEGFRPGLSAEILQNIRNKRGAARLEALKEYMLLEVQSRMATLDITRETSNWGAKKVYYALTEASILSGSDILTVRETSRSPEREQIARVYLAARKIVYPEAPAPE